MDTETKTSKTITQSHISTTLLSPEENLARCITGALSCFYKSWKRNELIPLKRRIAELEQKDADKA